MRLLMTNESCIFCYTYLKECTDRETCYLIKNKQRGGLVNPIVDIVAIVKIANKVYDQAYEKKNQFSHFGKNVTEEIVSEILSCHTFLLAELSHHEPKHRIGMLKKVIFTFIGMKAKHLMPKSNQENCAFIRNRNTKITSFSND